MPCNMHSTRNPRAYLRLGEYGKAIGFSEQYLEVARRIKDSQGEGSALGRMGGAYALTGEKEKAARAFAQSKAVFAKLELPHMVSTTDKIMKQFGLYGSYPI